MKHLIADFTVLVSKNTYHKYNIIAEDFVCSDARQTDLFLQVDEADIIYEIQYSERKFNGPNGILHASAIQRKLSERLPLNASFLLHSACFDVDGEGVAFCALSGTGKTTQMLNWQELLGDKMTVVNGDKPIVRFFDKDFCEKNNLDIPDGTKLGVPYAYGTPWNGKEGLGTNMRTELKHICFIERSETNFVTKPTKSEAVGRIMKQVYMPKDPVALANTLHLVDRLIDSCELWIIHCNMEPESAKVAYDAIFEGGTLHR